MEIKVNGKLMAVNDNTTVTNLVETICTDNMTGSGVAVAVNGAIVSKKDWSTHVLAPDCDVILIKAAYGG